MKKRPTLDEINRMTPDELRKIAEPESNRSVILKLLLLAAVVVVEYFLARWLLLP